MKIKKLIFSVTLICSSITAMSQTYVGFELCKKTSTEKVIQMLEKSGATNIKINRETEKYLYINVEAEQYPVANGFVKITLSITDNLLFGLYIKDENQDIKILELMGDKYGNPIEVGRLFGQPQYAYKSKDSKVSISGGTNSVEYSCEQINDRRMKKLKNEERKNNTGKSL